MCGWSFKNFAVIIVALFKKAFMRLCLAVIFEYFVNVQVSWPRTALTRLGCEYLDTMYSRSVMISGIGNRSGMSANFGPKLSKTDISYGISMLVVFLMNDSSYFM